MKTNSFELDVRVHGHSVKEYQHEGKTFIEGRQGSAFTIRVANLTPRTVLAVVSVDGLSVMDGKDASYASSGYVLGPYEKLDIPGWRLDLKNVAKFVFTVAGQSYAVTVDRPKNVGVIGCAFFDRKQQTILYQPTPILYYERPWPYWPWYCTVTNVNGGMAGWTSGTIEIKTSGGTVEPSNCTYLSCDVPLGNASGAVAPCDAAGAVAPCDAASASNTVEVNTVQQLGTGFGEQESHEVNTVAFLREDKPTEVIEIVYDTREGLTKRGVDLRPKPTAYMPQAFPGGFCKPPTGWTGK